MPAEGAEMRAELPHITADILARLRARDRKSTRLNSHVSISYAVFCLKKKPSLPGPPRPVAPGGRGGPAAVAGDARRAGGGPVAAGGQARLGDQALPAGDGRPGRLRRGE